MHDFAEILGYTISVAIDGAAHVIKAISFISKQFGDMFSWLNEGIQATIAKALIFGFVTFSLLYYTKPLFRGFCKRTLY